MRIPDEWTFKNKDVAKGFDSHVREQLPWYDLVSEAVVHIVKNYANENSLIYDIGASTGNFNILLSGIIADRKIKFIGLENSPEMISEYNGADEVILCDAIDYDYKDYDVAICFLTLMFIPFDKRKAFVNKLISKIKEGGCLIIVDKIEPSDGYLSTVLYRMALMEKMKTTEPKDILKKELSLSGVQRPLRRGMLDGVSREFFRFGDFVGWVIENK